MEQAMKMKTIEVPPVSSVYDISARDAEMNKWKDKNEKVEKLAERIFNMIKGENVEIAKLSLEFLARTLDKRINI